MIPQELKDRAVWCGWKRERNSKVPYNLNTGMRAASNDISTFASYAVAEQKANLYAGLGIGVFNGVSAIDIDHCVDPIMGVSDQAQDVIGTMNSYTETSPSGTGIRIIFFASKPFDKSKYYIKHNGLEVYVSGATNRFVTVTGDHISGELRTCDSELLQVLDKYMLRPAQDAPAQVAGVSFLTDEQVLQKANNSPKFVDLWQNGLGDSPSASEADLALCSMLAFWTNRDPEQMDRLVRMSNRLRPKWDEVHGADTYGNLTIQKAISLCSDTYTANVMTDFGDDVSRLAALKPDKNPTYPWNDIGIARLFVEWYSETLRYVHERKKWYVYNGTVWEADNGEDILVMEMLKRFTEVLKEYAKGKLETANDKEKGFAEDFLKHVTKMSKRSVREVILKDARGLCCVSATVFDRHKYQLNVLNGTLDLKTGEMHEHTPLDMHTMLANVTYDPTVRSQRWGQFVSEVMQDDTQKAQFVQRAMGYAMTGDTSLECMFMLYGPTTRNGKGTLTGTFAELLGDYAKTCSPDTLSQRRSNGSGPTEDLARLRGARFVNIPEPDRRMQLNTALVKTLTGGDILTARFLNENSVEYKPQFKLFINTNYLPTANDTTLFQSDRVHIIPFERHFAEQEQDKSLKNELQEPENLSGILNWCLEGLQEVLRSGLQPPAVVTEATKEYAQDNDRIGAFVAAEMVGGIGKSVTLADAYAQYKVWSDSNGYRPENMTGFKTSIERVADIGADKEIIGYALKGGTPSYFQAKNTTGA